MRDIPERHRSIRAVFDYSWKMLSEQEQDVLMRLSVFRGGWRVDESERVVGANRFHLRRLIDKSLVRHMGDERYDLHELIRQYASGKSCKHSGFENRRPINVMRKPTFSFVRISMESTEIRNAGQRHISI